MTQSGVKLTIQNVFESKIGVLYWRGNMKKSRYWGKDWNNVKVKAKVMSLFFRKGGGKKTVQVFSGVILIYAEFY